MVTKVLSVEEARILFLFQFFLLPGLSFYVMFFFSLPGFFKGLLAKGWFSCLFDA